MPLVAVSLVFFNPTFHQFGGKILQSTRVFFHSYLPTARLREIWTILTLKIFSSPTYRSYTVEFV